MKFIPFFLFLAGILSVSCSNKDKTGSCSNAKIDTTYKGNWYISGDSSSVFMAVKDDGDVSFPSVESMGATGKKLKEEEAHILLLTAYQVLLDMIVKITFKAASICSISITQENSTQDNFDLVKR